MVDVFKAYPGAKQLWVSSTKGSATNPGTRTRPLSTVTLAHDLCTANVGDVIIVMEAHREEYTAAGELTISKAGVHILGLGQGGQVPELAVGADQIAIVTSGAEVTWENINFVAAFADIAKGHNVTAKDVAFINCQWTDDAVGENWLTPLTSDSITDNDVDGLTIEGCTWYSVDTACLEFAQIDADVARLKFNNNFICTLGTNPTQGFLLTSGKSLQDVECIGNAVRGQVAASTVGFVIWGSESDNDGIIGYNVAGQLDVAGETAIAVVGCQTSQNYTSSIVTVSAYILPADDVNN